MLFRQLSVLLLKSVEISGLDFEVVVKLLVFVGQLTMNSVDLIDFVLEL